MAQGRFLVPGASFDFRQHTKISRTCKGIAFDRTKLNSAPCFTQCIFVPAQMGIDEGEDQQGFRAIGLLRLHSLGCRRLGFHACGRKGDFGGLPVIPQSAIP